MFYATAGKNDCERFSEELNRKLAEKWNFDQVLGADC